MDERLVQALVGFLQIHILAHNGNGYLAFGIGAIADQLFPGFQVGITRGQAQHDGHFLVKALLIKLEGHFINVVYVHRREHGVLVHIAEQGDLRGCSARSGRG